MPDGTAPPGERSAMSEETRTMQTADTTPARAPEDAPALVKKIGRTTYVVHVHFSKTSTETMSDKIKRMLKNEVRQMRAFCKFNVNLMKKSLTKCFWNYMTKRF